MPGAGGFARLLVRGQLLVFYKKTRHPSIPSGSVDSLLGNLCGKEPLAKFMETAERRPVSGLERKAQGISLGAQGYLFGALPSPPDPGDVRNLEWPSPPLPHLERIGG